MIVPLFFTIVLTLNLICIQCQVSFLYYCQDGSNPDPFPGIGKKSSGTVEMAKSAENGTWYLPNMNCSVTISAEANYQLLLTFSNVSLRNSSMDSLTVFYNGAQASDHIFGQQVCSNENCEGLKFDSGIYNNITLTFLSANVTVPNNVTGFKAHYTVYNLVAANGCKNKKQFLCENGHCIWNELVCDGHNNCGDRSDETKCNIPVKDTVWAIVIIVLAIVSVIIFVPLFCCLATYGTKNIVKSITLSNQATPLIPTTDCGETSGLLTSSEMVTNCWPGTSYERSNSFSYGTSHQAEPSSSTDGKQFRSMSEIVQPHTGKVL